MRMAQLELANFHQKKLFIKEREQLSARIIAKKSQRLTHSRAVELALIPFIRRW